MQEYLDCRLKVAQLNKKIRPSLEEFPNLADTDSLVKWLNNHFQILIETQSCIAWQEQLAKYLKMLHIPLELKIYGLFNGEKKDWYTNSHLNWIFYYHQFEEIPDKAIDYRKN